MKEIQRKFKITKFCNICLSDQNLETHHIKKISGPTIDKNDTFTQNIMRNLNRKQLVLCQSCHQKIHNGQYNGISLKEISDIRTSQIENHLKSYTTNFYDISLRSKTDNLKYQEAYQFNRDFKTVTNLRYYSQHISPPRKNT